MHDLVPLNYTDGVSDVAYLAYLATVRFLSYQEHGRSVGDSGFGIDGVSRAFGLDFDYVTDRSFVAGRRCIGGTVEDGVRGFEQDVGVGSFEEDCGGKVEVGSHLGCLSSEPVACAPPLVVEPGDCGVLPVGIGVESVCGGAGPETKTDRNRRWRAEKKERKKIRKAIGSDWRRRDVERQVSVDLMESSAAKWQAQNMLATEKARRELEILKANDLDQEIKRYRTKISAHTEKNMVSIEKTHAMLKASGNVPGCPPSVVPGLDHDVHTVSETISPDSSASQHEFRKCQKDLLDAQKKNEEYERAFKNLGVPLRVAANYDKQTFTDNTEGNELFQDIYGEGGEAIHYVVVDGKKKFRLGMDDDQYN